MSAQVFPVFPSDSPQAQGDWRKSFFEKLESILDEMEKGASMNNLLDITRTVFDRKSSILGEIPSGIIEARFSSFLNQEHFDCPLCAGKLKSRGKHKRKLETMAGEFTLERPYFYCANCKKGFCPPDEIPGFPPRPSNTTSKTWKPGFPVSFPSKRRPRLTVDAPGGK